MDITKQSTEQVKSLAYDTLVEIERLQNNLRVLNREIQERASSGLIHDADKPQVSMRDAAHPIIEETAPDNASS